MFTNIENIFAKKNIRLSVFIRQYCNKSKRSATSTRFYRRLARMIEAFERYLAIEVMTDSFTEKMIEDYLHFIRSCVPEKRGHTAYRQSTVRNFYRKTVSALRKAQKAGYRTNLDPFSEFNVSDEDSCAVYLTLPELERIEDLSLNRDSAQVRDIFLIGCFTALRYSDYSRLSEDNFSDGMLHIKTRKTGAYVTIPVHPVIHRIIERNKGYGFLKYNNSQQNFNKVIKNVCKKAGITQKILIERTEGFKVVRKLVPKYQLISTHTARRSGATNMYLAGIQPFRIMLITGHKTETAFYRYIRIQKEENARDLMNHPFFII